MKEVVNVPSHRHSLKAKNLEEIYICNGCQEKGVKWRYTCSACNYDMHIFCALPPPSIPHPLTGAKMKLRSSYVVKDSLWCSACERSVLGLRYSCTASRDVLHPCCAHLPKTQQMNSHKLVFSKNLSADPCKCCGQRTRGWAYVSREYSIHIRCIRKGLIEQKAQELTSFTPQPSRGRNHSSLQLAAAPSTSHRQHSKVVCQPVNFNHGFTTSGTLQIYQPFKSNHGFQAYCEKTKVFFRALRAIIFGDPSSILQLYMIFASYN